MTRPAEQDSLGTIWRVRALLEAFTPERSVMSIRELSAAADVPRSTTHRLSQTLIEWGLLQRTGAGISLGLRLFELGSLVPAQTTLRAVALPYMHTLRAVTKLTVNLAVREGAEIVLIEKIGSSTVRVPHTRFGGRGTLHATALGKALLAFGATSEEIAELAPTFVPLTPQTITTLSSLKTELDLVRREKAAFDVEESKAGLFCVAAPILDRHGVAIAAISVTGATALSQAQRLAPTVIATAFAIARPLTQRADVLRSRGW